MITKNTKFTTGQSAHSAIDGENPASNARRIENQIAIKTKGSDQARMNQPTQGSALAIDSIRND